VSSSSSSSSPLSPSTPAALPATTPPPGLLVSTPERPLILAFNLCEHELDALRSTGLGWEVLAVGGEGEEELRAGSLLDVAAGTVSLVEDEPEPPSSPSSSSSLSVRATLLVLPAGCTANDGASRGLAAYPAAVDEALTEAGCALCVTGVGVGVDKENFKNEPQLLSDALERLGRAHASVSGIWRPLPRLSEEEKVPKGATLAIAALLDAAPWDDDDDDDDDDGDGENEIRENIENLDLSGLAVLDGLLSPREASDLLLYLTEGDPSCPREGEKWQRGGVVDHVGGDGEEDEENENEPSTSSSSSSSSSSPPSSWGATPQFIASLLSDPPPELLALCSRLRALYSPEFAEVLLCPDNGEMSPGLSSLVLNAVTPEDAPSLSPHVDADPLRNDPDGAWARAFGLYRNRSAGSGSAGNGSGGQTRPLLATALLYFQDWPLEDAAETLFFDAEEVGLGLAVRPRAGRVVVSEQDVVHRIVPPRKKKLNSSSPSSNSPPRYSLVLKLALIPKKRSDDDTPTSVVLPDWRPRALRLGTAAARGPLPLA